MAVLAECGTFTAYKRHLRRGESVDEACAEAARGQKNARKDAERAESAALVALAVDDVQLPAEMDELADARENLIIVRAAMAAAPANAVAGLSKRRQELVAEIRRLESVTAPGVSALDQLAQRRASRIAGAAS